MTNIVTSSAPIDGSVLNFMRCAFGCNVFHGVRSRKTFVGALLDAIYNYNIGMYSFVNTLVFHDVRIKE